MGKNLATSVTDADCRFHDVDRHLRRRAGAVPHDRLAQSDADRDRACHVGSADHLLPPPSRPAGEWLPATCSTAPQKHAGRLREVADAGGGARSLGRLRSSHSPATGSACSITLPSSSTTSRCASTSVCRTRAGAATTTRACSSASAIRASRCCRHARPDVPGNAATVAVDTDTRFRSTRRRAGTRRRRARWLPLQRRRCHLQGDELRHRTGPAELHQQPAPRTGRLAHLRDQGDQPNVQGAPRRAARDDVHGRSDGSDGAVPGPQESEDSDSGFIGLQVHTGNVAFANIRVSP